MPLETETVGNIQIPIIPDGYEIDAPGAYRMSLEWYHSVDCTVGPGISSSGLRTIELRSPHAFWAESKLNPNRLPEKKPSDSMVLGRAAHCLMLGDEVFADVFYTVPSDAPKKPPAQAYRDRDFYKAWPAEYKFAGEWWDKFDAENWHKLHLKNDQLTQIQYMAESLAKRPDACEILSSPLVELSMIWQDDQTGVWIKSRPDNAASNGCDVGDLKTFAPRSKDLKRAAMTTITENGYAMQMALGIEGAERTLGLTATTAALVFIQTSAPYEPVVVQIEEEALHWARVLNRSAINKFAHGIETGEWPFSANEVVTYEFPPSMVERFATLQAMGELPPTEVRD